MGDNDIFEMDSVCETEDLEGDTELGMIDEDVGKRTALFFVRDCCLGVNVVRVYGYCWDLSGHVILELQLLGHSTHLWDS